ncbi:MULTISPECIES: hypothetical protein [unclassified Microcoleus]
MPDSLTESDRESSIVPESAKIQKITVRHAWLKSSPEKTIF